LLSFGGKLSSFWKACFRSAGNFPVSEKLAFVRRETFQFLESLLSFGGKLSSFWKACFRSAGNFPVSGKLAFVRRETFQFPESLLSFGGKLSGNGTTLRNYIANNFFQRLGKSS
jgi:hypothetical protein